MSLWVKVQDKVDKFADSNSGNFNKIVDDSVKKTFKILAGKENKLF